MAVGIPYEVAISKNLLRTLGLPGRPSFFAAPAALFSASVSMAAGASVIRPMSIAFRALATLATHVLIRRLAERSVSALPISIFVKYISVLNTRIDELVLSFLQMPFLN